MGKTRDLFKKIRDTKGIFYAKMGSIKDKWYGSNRSRRYQEEVARKHRRTAQKKDLHDQDNYDVVITHPEPDILECEVKWV